MALALFIGKERMRYRESKEQSSELLRLALPLMARQAAGLHPVSYALWYEHVAGLNPPLSKVLAERLESSRQLTEDEVYRLHAQHIVGRDVELLQSLQQRLHHLLEETAETAESAVENSAQFGQRLGARQLQLTLQVSIGSLRILIDEMIIETSRMQMMALEVSEKLEARAREVQVLTERLERAQTEALQDPLTGLMNRRGFARTVSEQVARVGDLSGTALLVADVDHFKRINDAHGHLIGDKVLQSIAQILQLNVRDGGIVARLGGEEFAVLLRNTDLGAAGRLAEKLRAAISVCRIRDARGKTYVGLVTVSLGVAVAQPRESLEQLIRRGDAAMYLAKQAGRDRVLVAASAEYAAESCG